MKEETFDLVVIGSGPGGYVAALRAAELGMKTACIEKEETFGGTCLNVGCIPSKALLESSHLFQKTKHHLSSHGIETKEVSLNLSQMLKRKTQVIKNLTQGISFLFKSKKVTPFFGQASFKSDKKILVENKKEKTLICFRFAIIATGSHPSSLPSSLAPPIDEKILVSSTGALSFSSPPQNLIVVGGGYIGLELGSVWARLGSKVKVIEFQKNIIPQMDEDLIRGLYKILQNQEGIEFHLSTSVEKIKLHSKGADVLVKKEGKDLSFKADRVLLSVGRKPHTEGLGLEGIGVKKDEKGFISVNEKYQTSISHIFAIGDVIGGLMLAHKAEQEGSACVELICEQKPLVSYHLVPSVLYTHPEVASVGKTEKELKEKNSSYKVGKFPFKANGRALSMEEQEGFVKILVDSKSGEILGAHILGASASEMIHEFCLGMEFSATAEDLALTMHAHPTLSETIKEAALSLR